MKKQIIFIILLILFSVFQNLSAQNGAPLPEKELEIQINKALDLFGEGEYEQAIAILENILAIDPENKRAADLLASIKELYRLERQLENPETTEEDDFISQRPDFSLGEDDETEPDPDEEDESIDKPDFSIRDKEELIRPEETRSRFELRFSPSLIYAWDVGEEVVVLPSSGSYSAGFSADINYFLNRWDRVFGLSGGYSLLVMDPEWGDFGDSILHVADFLVNFRTFFKEETDSRTIFRVGAGYRGYFSNGYDFYSLDRQWLNGFNLGINLDGPLLYLIWDRELLKRIVFAIDMNLLFFPEINTLNLFDFKIEAGLQFDHFFIGLHFGAYSVITPDDAEYLLMNGLSVSFRF